MPREVASHVLGPAYLRVRGVTLKTKRARESRIEISLLGSPRANALNESAFNSHVLGHPYEEA